MDIDQTSGNMWFVYHDRRNHKDTGTDVYVAVSKDGGLSFTESKISESPFYPDPEIFFGDYNNIAAHGNVVRPVWTRLDDKNLSVRTSIVDAYSILNESSSTLATTAETNGVLMVEHHLKGRVSVKIHTLNGEEVLSKTRLKSKEGTFRYPETSKLKSGIYLVEIDNGSEKAKGQWIKR
jgi:hypothetical protein